MRNQRFFWFLVAILFGLAAGLLAGWVLFPPSAGSSTPGQLRADYQADYVLMTAEIYASNMDVSTAIEFLTFISDAAPRNKVQQAIMTGQDLGFSQTDMQLLANLFTALEAGTLTPQVSTP